MGWIRNGVRDVLTIPEASYDNENLLANYQNIKNELEQVKAKFKLSWTTFRMFGHQIQYKRLDSIEHTRQLVVVETISIDRRTTPKGNASSQYTTLEISCFPH